MNAMDRTLEQCTPGMTPVWWLDQRPGCDLQDRQAMLDHLRDAGLSLRAVPDMATLDQPVRRHAAPDGVLLLFAADADQPELSYCLRQADRHGLPTIVLLSAVSSLDRARLIERGTDDCISDAIGGRELAARVLARCRRGRQHAAA